MKTIYEDISEWYHPEIDYWEMLNKFRVTRDPLRRAIELPDSFYRDHVSLIFHAKAWGYDETKPEGQREYPGDQQVFQFWNKQFNDELVKLIRKDHKLILDVGAGDGMLSKILHDRGFNVVAVDNYNWPFKMRYFKVHKMTYKQGLKKFEPDVVISSWMPLYKDWTPEFRKTKSVKQYILIGEVDAACGGDWKDRKRWPIKYAKKASYYALCRTDDLWWRDDGKMNDHFMAHHSAVHVFNRA
jgi:hypothetical protein